MPERLDLIASSYSRRVKVHATIIHESSAFRSEDSLEGMGFPEIKTVSFDITGAVGMLNLEAKRIKERYSGSPCHYNMKKRYALMSTVNAEKMRMTVGGRR